MSAFRWWRSGTVLHIQCLDCGASYAVSEDTRRSRIVYDQGKVRVVLEEFNITGFNCGLCPKKLEAPKRRGGRRRLPL